MLPRDPHKVRERLAGTTLELLAEHQQLGLVVDGQDTSAGDTTQDVGTSTLEQRLDTLLGNDLAGGVHGRLVLDGLEEKAVSICIHMFSQPAICDEEEIIRTSPEVIIIRRRTVSRG